MVDLSVRKGGDFMACFYMYKSLWNVPLKEAYKTQRILFYTFINNVSFSSETSNLFSVY